MYKIEFDKKSLKNIKKLSKVEGIKTLLSKIFDSIEAKGTHTAKCLDSKLNLYEIKRKKPAIRVYFYLRKSTITIVEAKVKKSLRTQSKLIQRIKNLNLFENISLIFLPHQLVFAGIQVKSPHILSHVAHP